MNWEIDFLNYLQEHVRTAFMDAFMPIITKLGNAGIFWMALAAVLFIFKKTRKVSCYMIIALALDVLLCNLIIKPVVARPRPFTINTDIILLVKKPTEYSFPSGHTAVSFTGAFAILFSGKKWWGIGAIILASVIAFSRLYLYVHYPTDIIGGFAIGLMCAVISMVVMKKILDSHKLDRLIEVEDGE